MISDDSEFLDELEHEIGDLEEGESKESGSNYVPRTIVVLDLDGCLMDWRPLALPADSQLAANHLLQDKRIGALVDLLTASVLPVFYMTHQDMSLADKISDWIEENGLPPSSVILQTSDFNQTEIAFKLRAVEKAIEATGADTALVISTAVNSKLAVKYRTRGYLHMHVVDPMVLN